MRESDERGRQGEDLAAAHLQRCGWQILDRNWRCREGELDIVARDGDALVVVEVKTRRTREFGTPLSAVTPVKVRRLRRLALAWLREREVHPASIRFDVIGIVDGETARPILEHVRGID